MRRNRNQTRPGSKPPRIVAAPRALPTGPQVVPIRANDDGSTGMLTTCGAVENHAIVGWEVGRNYQSPRISPPSRVTAPQKTPGSTLGLTVRTLPSNIPTSSPAENGVCRMPLQAASTLGRTWNVLPATEGFVIGDPFTDVVMGKTSSR